MDPVTLAWYLLLVAGVTTSVAVLVSLSRPRGRWGLTTRKRLVMGVPWGTLVAVVAVAAFYLFVQDGLANPRNPLDIPFRAYSYLYPIGILTAGFAHSGLGHVTGNLLSTLVFGSLAEYAWGHFPRRRGSFSFSSPLSNPLVRIAIWVCAIAVAAVLTSVFGLGPVIGFSGVVYAFVGFALVRFPIATAVVALSTRIVTELYNAVLVPEIQRTAVETFSRPWWAGIAIQGHALGLLLGATAGIALLHRRDVRPKPEHVWIAALAFAVDRGLWAIYVPEGSETFRLFRALGMASVFVLAALVASGATATTRELLPRIDLSRREAAFGSVLAVVLAISFVTVPLNLYAVDDPSAGLEDAEPTEIRDYTVFYAENVENQFVPAVPIPGQENVTDGRVNASGVIVVSERRNIWWEEVSAGRLETNGAATIRIGGLSWREDVRVTRETWAVAGGNSTHNVRLGPAAAEERPVVFRADPARSDAVVDGRNVTIAPVGDRFEARVFYRGDRVGSTVIPADNVTTTAGGLTFVRAGRSLFVKRGETRVRIAQRAA
ncbi:rhomboid family intramembrane serine protease [Natronomonas salsuginis]|jgi:membrane associated rhomboid family serine protease|uniref:Rhomboid family intramembrane serine protease n=1 Tax=Natronomonas salsuginis TaxID=2217661 RepID=A0A4U5JHA7_9EURY|nr:rhomboid family intramembrane serine protease [Natronomonas salsuginis]TKR27691.1 rhomboid family intramembrane serine protease [Natronomonas salsuginis]